MENTNNKQDVLIAKIGKDICYLKKIIETQNNSYNKRLEKVETDCVKKENINWLLKAKDRFATIGLVVVAVGVVIFTYLTSKFLH